ncbi:MAG: DUF456 domain-containing protein [Patescibacteria group bacterium]
MTYLILVMVFSLLILVGAASFLLMIFPAHLYLLAITLVFGFIDHFQHLKFWEWGILAGVVVIMTLVDWLAGLLGAQFSGASKKSLWWGLIGMIIGLLVFPPFGSLIGLFLGVLIVELIYYKEYRRAFRAAAGSLLGKISGTILNLILAILFLILFIFFALK